MSRTRLFDRKRLLGAVAASTLLAAASQGHALTINATFDSSITSLSNAAAVETAINNAISFYSVFTNPTTVSIDFQTGGGLGGSLTSLDLDPSYSDFTSGLAFNAFLNPQNTVLQTALNHLGSGNQKDVVFAPSADFRALGADAPGFLDSNGNFGGTFDGIIFLNASIMNFTNTVDPSLYPANPVIQHEVDEVLGIGGPDTLVNQPFGPDPFGDGSTYMGAEDLYRYAAPGTPSFTTDPNAHAYFSIDGGATDIMDFNQNGIGDFADWAKTTCSSPAHVQDWAGCPGKPQIGLNLDFPEVTGLQALGYDLPVGIPEPSAWALMIAGFGLAGSALRRRRLVAA